MKSLKNVAINTRMLYNQGDRKQFSKEVPAAGDFAATFGYSLHTGLLSKQASSPWQTRDPALTAYLSYAVSSQKKKHFDRAGRRAAFFKKFS